MAKRLKFAVLDLDESFHSLMNSNVNSGAIGDFFFNNIDFGKADIKKYDLIFIGNTGTSFKKEDIAQSIFTKTKAMIIVISENNEIISKDLVHSRVFRIVNRDTFNTYNEASNFLRPFYSIIEGRQNMKSIRAYVKNIHNNLSAKLA